MIQAGIVFKTGLIMISSSVHPQLMTFKDNFSILPETYTYIGLAECHII